MQHVLPSTTARNAVRGRSNTTKKRDRFADRQRRSRARKTNQAQAKAERAERIAAIAVKHDMKAKEATETYGGS